MSPGLTEYPRNVSRIMVTLHDIAEAAQVSPNTVSRALQPGTAYKRPTFAKRAKHIRQLAAEMGYRPNASARATREGKFNTISLLMSANESRSELPKKMFYGIQAAAAAHDLTVNLNIVEDDKLTDPAKLPKALREWQSDGLLINYHKHPPAQLQDIIDRYAIPSIFLNLDADHDSVRPDDFGAGRMAAEQLIELGHRRIWYVGYSYKHDDFHYSELERRDGYLAAMRNAGLEAHAIDIYHDRLGGKDVRVDAWQTLLASSDAPTAVITYGEVGRTIVLDAAARNGLRVPDDLSLSTFSGAPVFHGQSMTTWLAPEHEVGRRGIEMLMKKIDQPREALASRKIPFTLSDQGTSVAAYHPHDS